jgi:hypothetical protein
VFSGPSPEKRANHSERDALDCRYPCFRIAKIVNERRENIPSLTCAFLAHLLAAAFEVLAFELPVFGIRLGEMVGVDK